MKHETLIVGDGMHLMAECPTCGDLGSMVRNREGTPALNIINFLNQAINRHAHIQGGVR